MTRAGQHQADVKPNQISGFVFQTKSMQDMDEQEANAKLVLGTIYILLGMGLISMCINLMQEKIVSQVPIIIFFTAIIIVIIITIITITIIVSQVPYIMFFLAIIIVVIILTIITINIVIIKMPLQLQLLSSSKVSVLSSLLSSLTASFLVRISIYDRYHHCQHHHRINCHN
jgi:hypothetical protein